MRASAYLLSALFLTSSAWAAGGPLFPEDGSMRVNTWMIASRGGSGVQDVEALKQAFTREGIRLRVLESVKNQYLQDLGFVAENGGWISNAPYSDVIGNPDLFDGLTMNVANEDWGPVYVDPEEAKAEGLRVDRQMQATFAEGGALISGRRRNGTPYVIADDSVLKRAQRYTGKPREEALRLVATDLGVAVQDLILVNAFSHIDLQMLAIPGGRVLLSDPSLNRGLLEEALSGASEAEKPRLRAALDFDSAQAADSWSGARVPNEERMLAEMAAVMQAHGLEVLRVPGVIREGERDGGSWKRKATVINFFNGFGGKNAEGSSFYFTNSTRGLPSLERAFAERLSRITGVAADRVYFVGRFGDVAGLDCAGVPAFIRDN